MKVYKPVILAISTLQIMAFVAITPVIPQILIEFPNTDAVLIKAMVTLPAICALFASQLSGWLASFISKRRLVLAGIFLYFIGGWGEYFISSIHQMVASRLILGVGLGLFMPMTTGLVADFYSGNERTKMLGYSQAVNYFGGVVAILLAGYIAGDNWRNVFWIYSFSFLVFLVIAIGLPEPERKAKITAKYRMLPYKIYLFGICALLQMLVFYSCVTNISLRLKEMGINNPFVSSLGISILYLGCFFSGTFLTRIIAWFKSMTVFAAITMSAVGFFMIWIAQTEFLYLIGMTLVGAADGIILPYIYSVAAQYSPQEANGQTMATVVCFIFLGQFLAPLVFQVIIKFLGHNTVSGGFAGMAALLSLAALIAFVAALKSRHSGHNRQS